MTTKPELKAEMPGEIWAYKNDAGVYCCYPEKHFKPVGDVKYLRADKVHGLVEALRIAKRDISNWVTHEEARDAAVQYIDKALAAHKNKEIE